MTKITTSSIDNRTDYYQARAHVNGKIYNAFNSTRIGALIDVLTQLNFKNI